MLGKIGVTYDIKVEVKGLILTASTTIEQPPFIDWVWYEAQTDSSGIIKARVHPLGNKDMYLFTQVKSLKANENFHPSFTPCYHVKAGSDVFDLPVWRSRETNLYLINSTEHPYFGWPKYQYAINDTVYVKIGAINQTSFTVLKSIFTDQLSMENPFAFNGAQVQTNIVGGIGRWTGIATDSVFVVHQ